jgi:putative sterol carrier protein
MSRFESKEQAVSVFGELFRILLEDETFSGRFRELGLTLRIIQVKPDFELYVAPSGVRVDAGIEQAVLTIKMSCDTAHALWSGELLMPLALATGKLRVRGSVAKVLEFVPLLQPAFDRYPAIVAEAGAVA